MRRRNFFVPDPLMDRLSELARRTDVSMSEHVRQALQQYLDALGAKEVEDPVDRRQLPIQYPV